MERDGSTRGINTHIGVELEAYVEGIGEYPLRVLGRTRRALYVHNESQGYFYWLPRGKIQTGRVGVIIISRNVV